MADFIISRGDGFHGIEDSFTKGFLFCFVAFFKSLCFKRIPQTKDTQIFPIPSCKCYFKLTYQSSPSDLGLLALLTSRQGLQH